jgi:LmbE family N-acetylglucosaminyl deacetylase
MSNQIKTAEDIKRLGTVMGVWAHPDDESFCCAGIMNIASKNGQKVVCITATKGEAGVQDPERWPAKKLGKIRSKELSRALKQIGVRKHHWLGYSDGHLHEVDTQEAVAKIKKFIKKYQPDTILTFGPDGMTGHTDHQTVSKWTDEAAKGSNIAIYHSVEEQDHYKNYMQKADEKFNIYFNIDKPPVKKVEHCDIAFELPSAVLACKCSALKSMPSQTEGMFKALPDEFMNAMLGEEYFVKSKPN